MATIVYPVTYRFVLTAGAKATLNGLSSPVRVWMAKSCGIDATDLTAYLGGGNFDNSALERLALLLRRAGSTNRATLFTQVFP